MMNILYYISVQVMNAIIIIQKNAQVMKYLSRSNQEIK